MLVTLVKHVQLKCAQMVALDMVNVAQKNAASVYQAGKAMTAPKNHAQQKVLLH
jgi:hypothetical protein